MTSGGRRVWFLLVFLAVTVGPTPAFADIPSGPDIPSDYWGSIVVIGVVGLVVLLAAAALIAWGIVRLNRKAAHPLAGDDASATPPDAPSSS